MAAKGLLSPSPVSCTLPKAFERSISLLRRVNPSRGYSTKVEKKERRQQLIADFKQGSYFSHVKEFQRSGGKRFHAPDELFKKEDSAMFPNLTGKSLSGRTINLKEEFPNHLTLLLVAMRGIAQPMCDIYREEFSSKFKDNKKAKCIEINSIDSWFYGLFRYFIGKSLRKQISSDRHDSFMCYFGSIQSLLRQDLIGNLVVGHAFLIDREGYVRWKACAKPTEDELESMAKAAKLLLP